MVWILMKTYGDGGGQVPMKVFFNEAKAYAAASKLNAADDGDTYEVVDCDADQDI